MTSRRSRWRRAVIWTASLFLFSGIGGLVAAETSAAKSKDGWIELFNGKDLTGWKGTHKQNAWQSAAKVELHPGTNRRLAITEGEGVLVNGPKGSTCNLYTEHKHADCEVHVEFVVPKGSNSGIYFMGKYEIQILDSFGKKKLRPSDCGGIYGRYVGGKVIEGRPPRVNVSKPPGEWQTFDVIFRGPRFDASGKKTEDARFIKVVHNGEVVQENVPAKGPSRASMPGPEEATGPLMIQGNHGPVALRNIRIRPLKDAK